jgi:hypothetical protein
MQSVAMSKSMSTAVSGAVLTWSKFFDAVAHGSAISWQHINMLGEYDFSKEKLQDTAGIKPPKLNP